jgi:serine protease Do
MKRISMTLALTACGLATVLSGANAHAEAPASLRERQEKIQHVARDVQPAVVVLTPHLDDDPAQSTKGKKRLAMGSGSGVIVNKDGLVFTAAHVLEAVSPNGETFDITLANGDRVSAKPLGMNKNRDAAMAQITEAGPFPYVNEAAPDNLKEGEWLIAYGHHGGYQVDRTAPLRLGRLVQADNAGFLITDCTLSGGDSGGPLFDLDGHVVGIHSSISWSTAVNRHVPISAFAKHRDRLLKGDTWGKLSLTPKAKARNQLAPQHPALGVQVANTDDGEAVIVAAVTAGSPAEKGGVKQGDVIWKLNDTDITSQAILIKTVQAQKNGDTVKLQIKRNGQELSLNVTLVAAKDIAFEDEDEDE